MTHDDSTDLQKLLAEDLPVFESVSPREWFVEFSQATRETDPTLFNAIYGGRRSAFLGQAFLAGYQSAIECLLQPDPRQLTSFCVTEAGGNHPRDIATSLKSEDQHYVLNGTKSFVSCGPEACQLFIACRENHPDESRAALRIVALPSDAPGILIEAMPQLPFIPEIPHGKLALENVKVAPEQIQAGDGYTDYVKPFRTVEDLHVLAAIAAYRLSLGLNQHWPDKWLTEYAALISGLAGLGGASPQDPAMHLVLAGCRNHLTRLNDETDPFIEAADHNAFARWRRDKPLLQIAARAHEKRTQKAQAAIWSSVYPQK